MNIHTVDRRRVPNEETGSDRTTACLPRLVAAAILAACLAGAVSSAQKPPPPVESRAGELFEVLRGGDDAGLRSFLESALHDSFYEMGPIDLHLAQFRIIREALGDFEVRGIRLSSPHRGDFILRSGGGEVYALHLETEPIEPYRFAGVGFEPHEPKKDVPRYRDLQHVERHLSELDEAGLFAGVVLVARDGRPDWIRSYGMANKERKIANTPETRFNVGSITKSFTALAVMQLVEQGKIDLDAPMSRYLDAFPTEIADRVRILDLLRMESGYGDYLTSGLDERRDELRNLSDYVEWFRTMPIEFEPGTNRRYSNTGYVLLGAVVERVSGMSFYDYIEKHVFEPAGMSDSFFPSKTENPPRTAVGYTNYGPSGKGGYVETNRSMGDLRGTPAGGSYATAADLLRFNRALRANRLLGEEHTTLLLNFFEEGKARPSVRGVAGGAPGVSAISEEDTDAGIQVLVLSNYDEPMAEEIGQSIFRMLREGESRATEQRDGVARMHVLQDQPSVDVTVQGAGPFRFLIDTGAGGAGRISRALAERFGLEKAGEVLTGDPSGRNTETRNLVRVPELSFAGHTWRDVDMLLAGETVEDPGIEGILGFALFHDLLLTLDYPGEQVRVESGELPPADGDDVIEFRSEHGIPAIEIDVAGKKVSADIDSGSMGWLMVPESVANELPLAGEPKVIGKARTAFNEFEIKAAPVEGTVRVGGHELENPRLEFAGLFPRGNIGGQFLREFAVTFDQGNRRVRFARSEAQPLVREPRYRVGAMIAQSPDGWVIDGTVPGSPAERAGLLQGDRVARLNGTPVGELSREQAANAFGSPEEVVLEVRRDGKVIEIRLTPERM